MLHRYRALAGTRETGGYLYREVYAVPLPCDDYATFVVRRSVGRCSPGGGDGFESGVDPEGAKEAPYMVADCFRAQVEFGGDLLGGAALLQMAKHLG